MGQLHRVGPACGVLLLHRQVGLAQHDGDRLVVVHRHRHVGDGHPVVAAIGDPVGDRGGVVGGVAVVHGRHRDRLRRVPVLRGEGQGPRSGRHLGVVGGVVDRYRHVPAGLVAQYHGVGVGAALGDLELLDGGGDSHLDLDGVRGPQHADGHVGSGGGGIVRVVGAGHRVFDGDGGALGFGVGGDGDRLGRVPVVLGEGQGVVVVNAGQRQDGTLMAGQGYRNVPRRQGPQDHGVGVAAAGLDGEGRGADDHAEGLVVVHRHGQLLGHSLVLAPGTRVGQGHGVVLGVGVLSGLHRHRLRIVPGGRAEGQGVGPAQTAQRKVRGVLAGHRHRHLDRRLVGQLHRVGPACGVLLLHRQVGLAQHDGDRLVVVHRHRKVRLTRWRTRRLWPCGSG